MRRREFIKGIAGSAAMVRPIAALAREAHRVGGSKPEFQYFEAPIVIDNAAKEVVDNAA